MVKIDKDYASDGLAKNAGRSFDGRSQLVVYTMLGPGWEEG
jgi:predicted dithiol-disulfide oxidoreductase (DUF899 family)